MRALSVLLSLAVVSIVAKSSLNLTEGTFSKLQYNCIDLNGHGELNVRRLFHTKPYTTKTSRQKQLLVEA